MDKYILREWYIIITILSHHIASGFILALASVITPIIKNSDNQTRIDIHATDEQASWFLTSYGLTGPIGFLVLPAIMQVYGRRVSNVLLGCILVVGSIVLACSSEIISLTIGRAIHGIAFPGYIISCVIIGEYTHPKRRGFFIITKICASYVGELFCHSLGLKLSWRQLAWVSIVPATLGVIGTISWLESPAWLAFIGRYDDCEKNFEYYRGTGVEAQKELRELLSAQKELKKNSADYGVSIKTVIKAFRSKQFLQPLLISGLLICLIQASGYFFLTGYLIEIMRKFTKDTSKAYYFSIGADTVQIFAMLFTSFIIQILGRRIILFSFGSLAIAALALTCVSSYLDIVNILPVKWLTPLFLILYLFLCKISFLGVSVVSKGEIFPLKYRGLGTCVSGIMLAVGASIAYKLTGILIKSIDVHGMLAVNLLLCLGFMIWLFFVLPETKDRSLQEIENEFFKLPLKYSDDVKNLVDNAPKKSNL